LEFEYVDFPGIGLRVPVSRVLFSVFGLDVYTYAVIIAFALILMIFLGLRAAGRFGIKQDDIIDMMIFAIPASIICARLYYVAFTWDYYKANPIAILNLREGGLAIYGAVIGAFATVFVFTKIKKISPLAMLDFGVPYLVLAQGIGRWGNFVNQEAFGANTSLPWGMTSAEIVRRLNEFAPRLSAMGISVDASQPVHPTFLYESLWNIAIAAILFRLRGRKHFNGEVLCCYLIGYGIGRALIEGLRTDSLMLGSVRISQLLSVLFVIVCAVLFVAVRKNNPRRMTMESIRAGGGAGRAGANGGGDVIYGLDYKLGDIGLQNGDGDGDSGGKGESDGDGDGDESGADGGGEAGGDWSEAAGSGGDGDSGADGGGGSEAAGSDSDSIEGKTAGSDGDGGIEGGDGDAAAGD
jgi:phosphatidylglycerol:prolipoprotein diacylglycerol transferase